MGFTMMQQLPSFDLYQLNRPGPWVAAALVAVLIQALLRKRQTKPSETISNNNNGANKTTETAIPTSFQMSVPTPYPDWSLETTKPLPYRAFRYGPRYNITMGLRSLPPIEWIELDNHYTKFHTEKAKRLLERGDKCVKTDPEAYNAAMELLQELTNYLPARYPSLYRRTAVGIDNLWSGESLNITEVLLREDPMAMCARLVQDDLALMIEQPDGQYRLLAGAILLAGFWRLSDKFGMTLADIHTSGNVPHFEEKLQSGMMKFFQRLRCDTFYARNNYFIQVDDELAWSPSIGDEDEAVVSWGTAKKNKAIEHHFFRSERQTLRRLPRTGAIVFTIRTYFAPITEIAEEDCVPGRLASAVRSWDEWVGEYKGRDKYGEILLEYLDRKHAEQLQRGLDVDKVESSKSYPW
ncbi:Dextrin dextranase [Purpureocillium takamizusanense]|uniref:Dextrin dextranase n=1 Tax=Purpureocillium takamizusanense TaxID=2060973 RepID=A0A9Q8QTH5_9HYPO|nr:Dextrin dextranase [Purpureocillium takamizusanense]UNI25001.1 Dextrin dextranase [Purpureocillium takamizusanense]